jgi:O-methyltransferase involved in polyketide biosynthesis
MGVAGLSFEERDETMEREKITLSGAQETMLATLYARALDSKAPNSVLQDDEAARAVERIDYDFRKTGIKGTSAVGVAARAKTLDDWAVEFLKANTKCTVVHLACGLDTRVQRLMPTASVRWVDVDYPEVIELRERLLPTPTAEADYRMVGSSVTSEEWLKEIPNDRPTVAVFEGLSMYLTKTDGKRLIQRITGHFKSGQLLFDCYGTFGIKLQKWVPAVRRSGSTLHWGLDDPRELESWHDGLKCLDDVPSVTVGVHHMSASARMSMNLMAHLPGFRDVGRILRYEF